MRNLAAIIDRGIERLQQAKVLSLNLAEAKALIGGVSARADNAARGGKTFASGRSAYGPAENKRLRMEMAEQEQVDKWTRYLVGVNGHETLVRVRD